MANLSAIKLPSGITYNIKDNSGEKSAHNHELASIVPITSKTYTSSSYYATSSGSWEAASWYFMSVKPDSWDKPWKIRIRVHSFCPGYSNVESYTDALITGRRDGLAYSNYTERLDTAHYYIPYYTLKKAGFDADLGHAIGISILYGTGYTTAAYYRTFEVDFYESENCTVTFFDTPIKWSSWTNGNTTNYNSLGSLDAVTRGYTQSGDRNDVNYQNRIYYTYKKPYATLYRYQILLSRADGTLLPVNSVDNAPSNINKTLTTEEFDPFGEIYYYNSSTTRTTSQNLDNNVLYRQILADLRYSFNFTNESGKCLTGSQPVYIVATPQSNGMAKLASPALVQALPSTEDGKIYIYIGQAYPDTYPYRTELPLYHPIYWYKNGAICQYVGNPYTVNGHTVNSDVPSGAKFTDTVTTTTTTGSGNAVTAITASNGALTVTKGTTFLTSHQDISGKADKSATVSTITWNSANNKLTKTINGSTTDVVTLATIKTALGSMPASDVYSWAKAASKPSYTFSELTTHPTSISGYGITDAYTKTEVDNKVSAVLKYKGVKATVGDLPSTGNTTGDTWHVTATSGEYAWDGTEWQELGTAISIPANTGSSTTGISIAAHSTGSVIGVSSSTTSVYGVSSSTTTASKVTLGTAKSVPNVTSAGSASNWVFENVTVPIRADSATSIPNVTSAGTAASWTFGDVTVPIRADADTTVPTAASSATTVPKAATSATTVPIKNTNATTVPTAASSATACDDITSWAAGSGSASLTFTMDTTDTKKLKIAFSHSHTAPTLEYTARSITGISGSTSIYGVQSTTTSVTGVSGSTTVTGVSGSTTVRGVKTGTSSTTTASHVTGGGNGTAPTLGTAISIYGVKSGTGSTTTASHVKSGGNGTAPTLGTAISIPNVTGVTDVTVPIKNADATIVPIKNSSATTVVTSATHSVKDNGHTHTI